MANNSRTSHPIPGQNSGRMRHAATERRHHREFKWRNGVFGMDRMYYSSRNKAFLRNLSRRSTSHSFPIACNPHYSLLQLAYKLRIAEKAMYGNRPNAVAGQLPILHSNMNKTTGPISFKRHFEANSAMSGPSSMVRKGAEDRSNSLWPVLIGARGSDGLDLDEEILAKYKSPIGTTIEDDNPNKLAQPLSSTEVENIVQNAINCVINSKRQRPQGVFQSVSGGDGRLIKQEDGVSHSSGSTNNHSAPATTADEGSEEYQMTNQPFYELVKVGSGPAKNTPPPTPSLAGTVRKHRCPMCEYETDNKSHLRRHQSSVHRFNVPYICYICKREFPRSEKVKYHFQRVHPGVEYDPKACRKDNYEGGMPPDLATDELDTNGSEGSDSDDSSAPEDTPLDMSVEEQDYVPTGSASPALTIPIADHGDRRGLPCSSPSKLPLGALSPSKLGNERYTYKCPQCAYLGRDIWHLRRHMSDCHSVSKQFHCSQCTYATSRRHRMVSHMKSHGKLVCMYCDHACEDLESFQEHLRQCSSTHRASLRASQFLCKHCNTVMPNRTVLRKHLAKQHNIFLQSCHMCTYTTQSIKDFEKHLVEHSVKPEKHDQFTCSTCNEIFDNRQALENHTRTEHTVPPVAVPSVVSRSLRQKEMLSCSICDYKTQHRVVMKSHLRKHQEISEKEECSYPGCTFTTNTGGVMAKHINKCHKEEELLEKMHNAKGIFPCPVCIDRPPFRYRKSFEKHMDTHKKEEKCPLCEESFYTFDLLKKHIIGDHEAEVEEVSDSEDEGIDTKLEAVNQKPRKGRGRRSIKGAECSALPPILNKAQHREAALKQANVNQEEPMVIDIDDEEIPSCEGLNQGNKCNSTQGAITKNQNPANGALMDGVSDLTSDTGNTFSTEINCDNLQSQASNAADTLPQKREYNNNPDVLLDTIGDGTFDHSYAATVKQ